MKSIFLLVAASIFFVNSSCSQNGPNKRVTGNIGAPCEGCEAIYECPMPFEKLENMVWLPDWKEPGTKLAVNGIVYKPDGKTPAANVIIYIYHTDQKGVYPTKGGEKGWAKRHGYLRGWMRTNEKGEYKFFTLRPASYPNSHAPAHIHITIKEPGKNEYWIDEFLFDDDPFLTNEERSHLKNRCGSGILKTVEVEKGFLKAERHIYLGQNIPNYPKE
jgi:protocatechuate 3,4-dioxygenase beta subunit